ncbi:PASTA domain-containing protein [Kitasatospora misakiensis]|uniref:PASTA domain-containing protein n=1 Tax=Kitasatospora misakiensis TaxID=67330 RepID=A0ABW0X2V9_9ACTN
MALYCELCGTRADGAERLDVYCPGEYCGTDLRAGSDAGVRAWCEPPRRFGVAGGTVFTDLLVYNAGPRPTGFHIEPVEPVQGRLDFDRQAAEAPLPPGATRRVELRWTVPFDFVGLGLDIASRFGVPGADLAGRVQGARYSRFGVALRVAATSARQGAACAAFAVDVPGQLDVDPGDDDGSGHNGNGQSGNGPGGGNAEGGNDWGGRGGGGRPAPGRRPSPGQRQRPDGRTGGGCGPLVIAVLVAVVAVLVAVVLVLGVGRGSGSPSAGSGDTVPSQPSPAPVTSVVTVTSAASPSERPGTGTGTGNGNNGGGKVKPSPSPSPSPRTTSPSPSPRTVVLPPLAGLGQADAEAKLKALGLRSTARTVTAGRLPALQVLATEPAAGAEVPVGASVVLRVSDGRAAVPDIAGLTRADAEKFLRDLHFTKVTASGTEDRSKPVNQALRTDPAAGTVVPLDSPITLWYAAKPIIR